ncbi:MAG TPA: selenocysteine-specific translation elongation factor [Vicinamibacterales bacterium]|nr:selenocysteine-specific translation elongation factor [Vicinamibacterales bacterium]
MRSVVIGTAGHIDHGKSSLVLALTGTNPDRLKEEKARGITIDLGFAHLEHGGHTFAFVDVPGHERFVRNMLAGAGGIDAVLLVVAADESVMPQTREHFHICTLLHVGAGLIALTKSDLVDEDTLELCRLEVRELVKGSFLEGAAIVPVSSRTGEGLDVLRSELARTTATAPLRPADGPVRLPIDRAFSMKGFGTVITGTLISGTIAESSTLTLLPSGLDVKVRGLQVHGQEAKAALAGQRTAINVGGVDVADVSRGDVLCTPGAFVTTRRADLQVEMLADAKPLKHGARVRFHHGTAEILGRVALSGDTGHARIRFEAPAILTRGDRFILRAYSPPVTIGGGTVLDPHAGRGAIRTPAGRARFARLSTRAGARDAVAVFVDEKAGVGLPTQGLMSRAGLSPAAAEAVAGELREAGVVTAIGDLLVGSVLLANRSAALVQMVTAHHASQPLSSGLPREEARERLFGRDAPAVFDHVVASLERAGTLIARDTLSLAGHQLSLSDTEIRARDTLATTFRDAGFAPPDARTVASGGGSEPGLGDRMLKLLVREKTLVRVGDLVFHADALAQLKRDVKARKEGGEVKLDVALFKERYGVSRKFAIPLLEYLDRERVTRRVGDARIIL